MFCQRLSLSLKRTGIPVNKRNIHDNPADAAIVRSIADGNETVPTVVVGGKAHTNPEPAFVRDQLAA